MDIMRERQETGDVPGSTLQREARLRAHRPPTP
jgi:hypothetical protein